MTDKRIVDRVLLLLAIKPPRKLVTLDHIVEKVSRDCGATPEEILKALNNLIAGGYAEKIRDKYRVTEKGRKDAWSLAYDEEMNKSYRLVLLARYYYPKAAEAILPFLKDRPVSVVKIFSDKKDPINKVAPVFSRYAKMKPKRYHFINTVEEILKYVDMHAIDFIPYVHKIGKDYPDWLIIDLDAGDDIKNAGKLGFNLIKEVTIETVRVMEEDLHLKPYIKFSGSRGFQIWVKFDKPLGRFDRYRKAVVLIRDLVEERLSQRYDHFSEKYGSIVDKPITTATVAKKEQRRKQILLDWSSLKLEGDVRAPFSMHYKTGLISVPVEKEKILDFDPTYARPDSVIQNLGKLIKAFEMESSDASELDKRLGKEGLLAFIG